PDLATGSGGGVWENGMLYKEQRPHVGGGGLGAAPVESEGGGGAPEVPGGGGGGAAPRGGYARRRGAHDAVPRHAAGPPPERGREFVGRCWEIYGHGRADASEQETDVFWLLR